jgi:hypothetical protein
MRRFFVFGERRGSPDLADAGKARPAGMQRRWMTALARCWRVMMPESAPFLRSQNDATAALLLAMVSGCDGRSRATTASSRHLVSRFDEEDGISAR